MDSCRQITDSDTGGCLPLPPFRCNTESGNVTREVTVATDAKTLGLINVERTELEPAHWLEEPTDGDREAIRKQAERQDLAAHPIVIPVAVPVAAEVELMRGIWAQESAAKPKVESEAARAERRQKAIQPLLKNMGWSRNKWATKAGVEFKTVANYLKGITMPSPETCKCLAEVLGIPVDKLPA